MGIDNTKYGLPKSSTILKIEPDFFGSIIGVNPENVKCNVPSVHLQFYHFSNFLGLFEYEDDSNILLKFTNDELGNIDVVLSEFGWNRITFGETILSIKTESFDEKILFLSRILNQKNLLAVIKVFLYYEYNEIKLLFNKAYAETNNISVEHTYEQYNECSKLAMNKVNAYFEKPKLFSRTPTLKEAKEYVALLENYQNRINIFGKPRIALINIQYYIIEPLLNEKFHDLVFNNIDTEKENFRRLLAENLPSVFNYDIIFSYSYYYKKNPHIIISSLIKDKNHFYNEYTFLRDR